MKFNEDQVLFFLNLFCCPLAAIPYCVYDILLLDEPTNHLDVDAKDSLKKALLDYRGSVLLICHEPEFYQDVVHAVWDCRVEGV